jgi:acetyltransferase
VFKLARRVAQERLSRVCFIDYDRDMVLVADRRDPATGVHQILGVGRLDKLPGSDGAEFALLVRDDFQGRGLGTALLGQLIEFARGERLGHIVADILGENRPMRRICSKLGFHPLPGEDQLVVRTELDLTSEHRNPRV